MQPCCGQDTSFRGAKKAFSLPEKEPLPQPKHIVAVSPGEVPWNDAEKARMQALNPRDVAIDYAFMEKVEVFMRHGQENVPDYMISGSRGDFSGVGDIHFFYSADEVLYGALPDFEQACQKASVPYTSFASPGMVHCYCMLPAFKEEKEDFAKITAILKIQSKERYFMKIKERYQCSKRI